MKLDKELISRLMWVISNFGPDDYERAEDLSSMSEVMSTIQSHAQWAMDGGDLIHMIAAAGASFHMGFELGLQYAELTRGEVKK